MAAETCQRLVIRDWLPEQLANGTIGHWSKRYRALQTAKLTTWVNAKQAYWHKVDGRAHLTITLVFPVHRRRDADNLHSRVKGVIDGIKPFIVDDSTDWLDLDVRAVVERGVRETRIELEPA